MTAQTIPERLAVVEDELQHLESMIDSRTRRLWQELTEVKAALREIQQILSEEKP